MTDTSMGWVTLAACRFLMRQIARGMGNVEMEPVQSCLMIQALKVSESTTTLLIPNKPIFAIRYRVP